MSEIMEASNDAHSSDHSRRKNKFNLTSFPDYVRKVQQLSFSPAVSDGEKTLPSGIKKQNLSRALSCFTTTSNSPSLPCKTSGAVKQPRLPPLHASRRQMKELQLKKSPRQADNSSNDSTPVRPLPVDHIRTQEASIHRASSFPLVSEGGKATPHIASKCKRAAVGMNKSPYLQPLVHKTYYTPKAQRRKRVKQQIKISTTEQHKTERDELQIPCITLRAATPLDNGDELTSSLTDQFTAKKQLAAELDKLNREMQDIVVLVEQVE